MCKLKRSIYGLKQSSRCWNVAFKRHMESANFKQCTADPCIFVKSEGAELSIVSVYVDDLIIIMRDLKTMKQIKEDLTASFTMKDLGKLHYCLGITMEYDEEKNCLWMHQRQYINSLKQRHPQHQLTPT